AGRHGDGRGGRADRQGAWAPAGGVPGDGAHAAARPRLRRLSGRPRARPGLRAAPRVARADGALVRRPGAGHPGAARARGTVTALRPPGPVSMTPTAGTSAEAGNPDRWRR